MPTETSFWCENCGKPCRPTLRGHEAPLGSDCCEGYLLRRITDDEEADILADIHAEADAERTSAERARNNWLNRE